MSIKNVKQANIIVVTETDDTFQKIISLVQQSDNRNELINSTKRVSSESNEDKTSVTRKRRKTDLTCVICNDKCSGYNFNVISCESCKSFFYRNASQKLNDLKCLTDTNHCNIKFNNNSKRKMCRRCRLKKCLSVGMKWTSTEDEKLNKQREMEENRRLTKASIRSTSTLNVKESQQNLLSFQDFNRMNSITRSYERAFRFSEVKYNQCDFSHITNRRSGLIYTVSLFHEIILKLITFIRSIPEFELLNEQDRFIIVKYNSPIVIYMYFCLHYNRQKNLVLISDAETEEHAMACQQLSFYCFGVEIELLSVELYRSIKELTNDDPIILQLILVILIFTKSVSAEDIVENEQPIVVSSKQVYEAQSIYADLLFRYMIEKYSTYDQAALRYSKLIQKIFQMQLLARAYQEYLREQLADTRDDELNPITKSILRIN